MKNPLDGEPIRIHAGEWVAHEHGGNATECARIDAIYANDPRWPQIKANAIKELEPYRLKRKFRARQA